MLQELINLRRTLHSIPETAQEEFKTKETVLNFTRQCPPDSFIELGSTALALVFNGKSSGKTIMFRCEMDALPLHESNTFDYRSQHQGKAHLCGHDGHMAIMLGFAQYLYKNKPQKGKIVLLFQAAEENGEGAKDIIKNPEFEKIKPDYIFAMHNVPGFEKACIVVKKGVFTPSVISIIIKLEGKTSHAAEPHKGINPTSALCEIIQKTLLLNSTSEIPESFVLITPIYTQIGSMAYGTSAGYGETHLTIRTFNNALMKEVLKETEHIVDNCCINKNITHQISYTQEFKANENDSETVEFIKEAALKSHLTIIEKETPFPWGEDFGLFTSHFKGAMFGMGAGINSAALHNPDYDFPDDIIENAIKAYKNILNVVLS